MGYDFNIVTLHRAQSFGAALQAYALQTHLEGLGYSAGIYDAEQIPAPENKSLRGRIVRGALGISRRLNREAQGEVSRKFSEFTRDNFHLTKCESSRVYLAGSDQVWNPIVINPEYFLDFAPESAVKASYAASIGVSSIHGEMADTYRKYLGAFDYVSVREADAKVELERLTGRGDIRVDCDPSFLLTRSEWTELSYRGEGGGGKAYILLYLLHVPRNINRLCRWLKDELNAELVLIDNGGYLGCRVCHDRRLKSVGPYDFLALVRDASAVITTSFHGTAFSIIFEKEFYSIINEQFPSRVNNILRHFQIDGVSDDRRAFKRAEIDYEAVGRLITADREYSDEYFRKLIETDKATVDHAK